MVSGIGVSPPIWDAPNRRYGGGWIGPRPRMQWIHHRGVQRLIQVAPEVFTELRLGANPLRDALSVLAAAAYWDRHRFGFIEPTWTLIGTYTRGRLLAPPG